LYGLFQP